MFMLGPRPKRQRVAPERAFDSLRSGVNARAPSGPTPGSIPPQTPNGAVPDASRGESPESGRNRQECAERCRDLP